MAHAARKPRVGRKPKTGRKPKAGRKPQAALKIDVLVESGLWTRTRDVKAMVRRAVTESAALLSTPRAELAILLTDDSAIRSLNRTWRGVDAATNVLSFPAGHTAGEPLLLGDIALACETIAAEAVAEGKPFAHHVAHLAVHGFLHLLGYDHERAKAAETMERLERDILQRLAIPDPYGRPDRSAAKSRRSARAD
jgi:probable rRNA maturation factor